MDLQLSANENLSQSRPDRGWRGYAVALCAAGLALGIKLLLRKLLGNQPAFPLFYGAVLAAAWYGGMRPGLLVTAIATLSGMYFFPSGPAFPTEGWPTEVLRDVIFILEACLICWGVEVLHAANRRAKELARDLRNERYRLLDTAYEGILTIDTTGHIDYANRRMLEMLGLPFAELHGRALSDFTRDEETVTLRRALAGEPLGLAYAHLRCAGGEEIMTQFSASTMLRSGVVVGTLAMFTDVTSRMNTERVLRRTEQELRSITETMPQIVWTTSPQGVADYHNGRWFELTGMTEEDAYRSDGWIKSLHPDDRARVLAAWNHSLQSGDAFEAEFRIRREADDSYGHYLGRALPLRADDGAILKWVGTCTDLERQSAAEPAHHTPLHAPSNAADAALLAATAKRGG